MNEILSLYCNNAFILTPSRSLSAPLFFSLFHHFSTTPSPSPTAVAVTYIVQLLQSAEEAETERSDSHIPHCILSTRSYQSITPHLLTKFLSSKTDHVDQEELRWRRGEWDRGPSFVPFMTAHRSVPFPRRCWKVTEVSRRLEM